MSEKERQKKDGQDTNKKNQRQREADATRANKRAASSRKSGSKLTESDRIAGKTGLDKGNRISSSPAAARAHASKTQKGK